MGMFMARSGLLFYGGLMAAGIFLALFIGIATYLIIRRVKPTEKPSGNDEKRILRHRVINRVLLALTAILLLVSFFISNIGLRQMEYMRRAFTFAERSAIALNEGDREAAVAHALLALTQDENIFALPHTPLAIKALTNALGVYLLEDSFEYFSTLQLPSAPSKITISQNGKTLAAICENEIVIIDIENTETIARLQAVESTIADAIFLDNTRLAFAGIDGLTIYDLTENSVQWIGEPATAIAVSGDGSTIAAIYRDESLATIYDVYGDVKKTVNLRGKSQSVDNNYIFANHKNSLLELNEEGTHLTVSFADGSLTMFDLTEDWIIDILEPPHDYIHFEGGFMGEYFAFSASGEDSSFFAVIDTQHAQQRGGFSSESYLGVTVNEAGIFVSSNNLVVKIDPETGEQTEVAFLKADIRNFAVNVHAVASAVDYSYGFFKERQPLGVFESIYVFDFVDLAGDYAVLGRRFNSEVIIRRLNDQAQSHVFSYDPSYAHSQARFNAEMTRVMLFSSEGFRIYDTRGNILTEYLIPDAEMVYELRHSKKSGNLAVIYENALRVYCGNEGILLFEETDLKSIFYAEYGISILGYDNLLRLIDIDSLEELFAEEVESEFAAYCGIIVGNEFLGDRVLLGASRNRNSYVFAVGDELSVEVYNGRGRKMFDIAIEGASNAFFTDNLVIVSSSDKISSAYSLRSGSKIRDLERDAYLTCVICLGDGKIITRYQLANENYYGLLLDESTGETLAFLPYFADVMDDNLLFKYLTGTLRQSRLFSSDELINIARGYNQATKQ